jgi:hypothetical protein
MYRQREANMKASEDLGLPTQGEEYSIEENESGRWYVYRGFRKVEGPFALRISAESAMRKRFVSDLIDLQNAPNPLE